MSYCAATGQPHPAASSKRRFCTQCSDKLPEVAIAVTPARPAGSSLNPVLLEDTPDQVSSIQSDIVISQSSSSLFIPQANVNQVKQWTSSFEKGARTEAQVARNSGFNKREGSIVSSSSITQPKMQINIIIINSIYI